MLSPLNRLTDRTGLVEHAWYAVPRTGYGYCTDDNGRALGLVCEVGGTDAALLAWRYLTFLRNAHVGSGVFKLRLRGDNHWTDDATSDDANGRALRGIGTAAATGPSPSLRRAARAFFNQVHMWRSDSWRATANAALGASALLVAEPNHRGARTLAADALADLPRPRLNKAWPWPEGRLAYENALLPRSLIELGELLGDSQAVEDGASLLRWLISVESLEDRFSFVPVGGRGPGGPQPAFDQQPVEAWAMAEAALVAMRVTPGATFAWAVERAINWFDGHNDVQLSMVDQVTGGCYDGLEPKSVNQNQGAESQLAVLAVRLVGYRFFNQFQLAGPL